MLIVKNSAANETEADVDASFAGPDQSQMRFDLARVQLKKVVVALAESLPAVSIAMTVMVLRPSST